jgi:methyl-accepting chemotaxis protein
MKNLSLKSILVSIVAVLCVTALSVGAVGLLSIRSLQDHQREIASNQLPSIRILGQINADTLAYRLQLRKVVESSKADELARTIEGLRAPLDDLAKDSAVFEKFIANDRERMHWEDFRSNWRKFLEVSDRIVALMRAGQQDQAIDTYNQQGVDSVVAASNALNANLDLNNREANAAIADGESVGKLAMMLSLVLLSLAVAISVAAFVLMRTRIVSPILSITSAMKELSSGNLAGEVPFADRRDELGQMAGAVQVFKDNAIRVKALEDEEKKAAAERLRRAQSMVEVVSEVGDVVRRAAEGDFSARLQVQSDDPEMRKLVAGINEINQVVDAATAEFAEVLGSLAQGDLTRTVRTTYRGRFGELKDALNETVDRLSVTVTTIQGTAREVSAAAGEINTGANDLSQRTEQQASSLEQTAATTEQLAASVKASAGSSRNAVELAEQAMGVARDGGDIAVKAVEAMTRIESASQKISDITGVIDEIAFQTNLLALNAAVEAARAGDAGKGFAVVASEVRTLAQRSSEAAKEITALINASVAEVGQGVQLVRSAGDALGKIVQASQKVTATVTEISTAAAEQANGIDEMSQAVAHMDEMTQQNAALAEESAASASSLSDQINRLNDLVATFKVAGSASGGIFGTPTIPHALRERAQQAFAGAKPRAPAKAAPKMQASASKSPARTGTWDEF